MAIDQKFDDISASIASVASTPLGVQPYEKQKFAKHGYPGVLPLWHGDFTDIGLLAKPGVGWEQWPVVILQTGQAVTLATNLATALPRFLIQNSIANLPDEASELAKRWPEVQATAEALHKALGGDAESLTVVTKVLQDEAAMARLNVRSENDRDYETALGAIFKQIDSSGQFGAYHDFLVRRLSGEKPRSRFGQLDQWQRQALWWTIVLDGNQAFDSIDSNIFRTSFEEYAGVDDGLPSQITWDRINDGPADANLLTAADLAKGRPALKTQMTTTIIESMLQSGLSYNGLAHAEAVPLADEAGEPERAWGLLNSAAWWMARSGGEIPAAIFDGARLLCDRHGWDDIRWVLDHNESR
jgi:hypothetical protein